MPKKNVDRMGRFLYATIINIGATEKLRAERRLQRSMDASRPFALLCFACRHPGSNAARLMNLLGYSAVAMPQILRLNFVTTCVDRVAFSVLVEIFRL